MSKSKSLVEVWPERSGIKIYKTLNRTKGATYGESFQVVVPVRITRTGKRKWIQKQTLSDARDAAEEQYKQGPDFFELSSWQIAEARRAFEKLEDSGLELTRCVEFALQHLASPKSSLKVEEAYLKLLNDKEERKSKGELRQKSVLDFKHRCRRFSDTFKDHKLNTLTKSELIAYLRGLTDDRTGKPLGPRTRRNHFRTISELFNHYKETGALAANPLENLSKTQMRTICGTGKSEEEPGILTVKQAETLLIKALETEPEEGLLAAVTLGLFAGIRVEELKRLNWSDLHLDAETPFVYIGARIAKTRSVRTVDLPQAAIDWLAHCRKKTGAITRHSYSRDFENRFQKLRELAGFVVKDEKKARGTASTWPSNAMRHSFGSYKYALTKDSIQTAEALGHNQSDKMLFDHYRKLARKEEAEAFFAIEAPKSERGEVVPFAS